MQREKTDDDQTGFPYLLVLREKQQLPRLLGPFCLVVALEQAAGTATLKTNERNNNKTKEPKQLSKEYMIGKRRGVLLENQR